MGFRNLVHVTLFLTFQVFTFQVFATPEQAVVAVDLNQNYEPLLKKESFDFFDAQVTTQELIYSNFTELEDYVVFFTYGDDIGFEPHILTKATNKVELLSDLDGLNKPYSQFGNSVISFPLMQNKFIFYLNSSSENVYFIVDLESRNISEWRPPEDISFHHIEPISPNEWLLFSGFRVYYVNIETNQLTEVTDYNKRITRVARNSQNIMAISEPTLEQASILIIDSDTLSSNTINFDYSLVANMPGTKTNRIDDSTFYFLKTSNNQQYLSSIGQNGELINYFQLSEIPQCNNVDTMTISATDGVFEDERFVYFKSRSASQSSNLVECVVRFDPVTKEFISIAQIDIGAGRNWSIIGAGDGKLVLNIDFSPRIERRFDNLVQIDFDQPSSKYLIEPINNDSSIKIISASKTIAFGYLGYPCSEKCLDNKFFKVNFNTGEVIIFGSRIGVSDKKSNITPDLSAYIVNDELIYIAAVPYPSLVTTVSAKGNSKLLAMPFIQNDTIPNDIIDIVPYSQGWIVTDFFADTAYDVAFNGTRNEIEFVDGDWFGVIFKIIEVDNKQYLIDSGVWEYDRNTGVATRLVRSLMDDAAASFSSVIDLVNGVIYGYGNDSSLLAMSLVSGEPEVINALPLTKILKCADNIFAYLGSSSEFASLTPFSNFQILRDNEFIEMIIPMAPDGQTFVNIDGVANGYVFFLDSTQIHILNCETAEIASSEHEFGPGAGSGGFTIQYNAYNKSFYVLSLVENERLLYKFDPKTNAKTLKYSGRVNFRLAFSENDVYAVPEDRQILPFSLYKLQNGRLIDMFPERSEQVIYRLERLISDVSASRFIAGTLTTETDSIFSSLSIGSEPFIYDTLLDRMHTFDLYRGPGNGFNFSNLSINNGYLAFSSQTEEFNDALSLIDMECGIGEACKTRTNRAPIIDESEIILYYEKGDNVFFPFRAIDEDLDPLTYSIVGGPTWLTIADNGLVRGEVPQESGLSYTFQVSVSDSSIERLSKTHFLMIDDGSITVDLPSQPPALPPAPPPEPQRPVISTESGGGSINYFFILISVLIYSARRIAAKKWKNIFDKKYRGTSKRIW